MDAGEGLAVQGGVALGAERGHRQGGGQDAGQLADQADALVDVVGGLARDANHEVELEAGQVVLAGQPGDLDELVGPGAPLEVLAEPLAGAVHGRGEGAVAHVAQGGHEGLVETLRAQARQAHVEVPGGQSAQDGDDLGVVAHSRADQADPACLRRDLVQHASGLDHSHAGAPGPAHDAVGTAPGAAPHGLDQDHVGQLGGRGADGGHGGQQGIVTASESGQLLAVVGGNVEVIEGGQGGQGLVPIAGVPHDLQSVHGQGVCLAHDDRIDEGGKGQRVGEGERAAGQDDGVTAVPVPSQSRNAARFQQLHHAGHLELIGHGQGHDGKIAQRAHVLVGPEARLEQAVAGVVGQEEPLAGHGRLGLDGSVDLQQAEGAHPHGIGRGASQGDAEGGLFVDPALLQVEPLAGELGESVTPHQAPPRSRRAQGHELWVEGSTLGWCHCKAPAPAGRNGWPAGAPGRASRAGYLGVGGTTTSLMGWTLAPAG